MSQIGDFLLTDGICALPELYTEDEIAAINEAMNPLMGGRINEKRAYVHPDEMLELGVFDLAFNERMKSLLFSIVPDPVLYHCHVYEIAANDSRSHIFADSLMGWHRDPDSEYVAGDPTHVSIFVYLTNVGMDDGAFEFIPAVPPTKWLQNGTPYIAVRGQAGYSFAWHRRYYHRASPNRGPVRRRLLKLSIQRNAFPSVHLLNPHFQKVLKSVPSGDAQMDLLLGRYQGKETVRLDQVPGPRVVAIPPNETLNLSSVDLVKAQLRERAGSIKRKMQGKKEPVVAAYD